MNLPRAVAVVVPFVTALGCASEPAGSDARDESRDESIGTVAQPERWSAADDPALFGYEVERRFALLPRQGAATKQPWPGAYWPTHRDSINDRWAGPNVPSAAEKYGRAFGVAGVENAVSAQYGIDSISWATSCATTASCNAQRGEECSKRRGAAIGRCIPTWFGLCHAWAAASVLLPEPEHPVTYNGVTFQVNDIKALLALAYDRTSSRLVSQRCNASDGHGEVQYNAYGRPVAAQCRDTNPGTFHLLLTNYVGRGGQSFIFDDSFDAEVWSRPLRDFRIEESRWLSAGEANGLLGAGGQPQYAFNPAARAWVLVVLRTSSLVSTSNQVDGYLSNHLDAFTSRARYDYVLELDAAGGIIGGEWVGEARRYHPDFSYLPIRNELSSFANGTITYANIRMLLERSIQ